MCKLGYYIKGEGIMENASRKITHEVRTGSCPKCDSLRVIVSKLPCYNDNDVMMGHVYSYGCMDCGHNWEVVKSDC